MGMKISELIEKLSEFDGDAEVLICTYSHRICQIEEVATAHADDPIGSAIIYIDT